MTLIDGSNEMIGHLGIGAGLYDTLEIGQYIDEVIPKTRTSQNNARHPSKIPQPERTGV